MLLSLVVTLLGPAAAGRLRGVMQLLSLPFAPFSDVGMYLTSGIKAHTAPAEELSDEQARQLQRENEDLRRRVNTLETHVQLARRAFTNGKQVFSSLFGPSDDTPVRLIAAHVLAADSLPYGWTRVVNVGERGGAAVGMYVTQRRVLTDRSKRLPENLAVLSGTALAGRLSESGAFTARLQMVTDKAFAIRAQVRRVINPRQPRMVRVGARLAPLRAEYNTPVEVFARGDGTTGLIVREVNKIHNILPGDALQTRPTIGSLPVAVDIGTVVKVVDDDEHPGRLTLHVRPSVDPASLREVFIVVPAMGRLKSGGGR